MNRQIIVILEDNTTANFWWRDGQKGGTMQRNKTELQIMRDTLTEAVQMLEFDILALSDDAHANVNIPSVALEVDT